MRDFRSDLGVRTFNAQRERHRAAFHGELSFPTPAVHRPSPMLRQRQAPLASRTEVTVLRIWEDSPRYAFEQGANNSFFYSEEPLA